MQFLLRSLFPFRYQFSGMPLPLSGQLLGVSYIVPETGSRQTILMCSQRIFPALVIFKTERTYARRFFGAFSKSSSLVSASLLFIGGEIRKNGPDR
jgi:hypothetical protein